MCKKGEKQKKKKTKEETSYEREKEETGDEYKIRTATFPNIFLTKYFFIRKMHTVHSFGPN